MWLADIDPAMAALYGEVIATKMHSLGLHVFEAPGVNLARLPILIAERSGACRWL